MSSFDNTEIAFKGKTDRELLWTFRLFKAIGRPWLTIVASVLSKTAIFNLFPFRNFVKRTIFRQFCGGETIAECTPKIEALSRFGIGTILDYSVEGKTTNLEFDQTCQEIIGTIRKAHRDQNVPFSVFKPTGLASMALLEKINRTDAILDEEERIESERYFERFDSICKTAFDLNIPVFIDAEDSWIQDGIDRLAQQMMQKYNRYQAIIFNTVQMYRTGRLEFIKESYQGAREGNYFLGIKLVRGAYMEKERERAAEKGYPSPIQPDKRTTDHEFNLALQYMIQRIDKITFCCATHNEQSSDFLIELMNKYEISRHDKRIFSAQLLGMSDHITYALAHNGFNVAKYVPYGPVKEVIPYLLRRAKENTSVVGQAGREISLITKERERRSYLPVVNK